MNGEAESKTYKEIMKYQFDNPPTRQAMIEELGVNPDRLFLAEESIRSIAKNEDGWDGRKDESDAGEAAGLLLRWGLVEAFSLYCLRAGEEARRGDLLLCGGLGVCFIEVLDWWGDSYRISAEFDLSGRLKSMDAAKSGPRHLGHGNLLTVIRFPLSKTQAYRKLLAERWYDPDVPHSERFVCPLDRKDFESWEKMAWKSKDEAVMDSSGVQGDPKP
jgi:hypothetical protein